MSYTNRFGSEGNKTSVLDTYNVEDNKCGLLYIDAHFEINDLGSRHEYVK